MSAGHSIFNLPWDKDVAHAPGTSARPRRRKRKRGATDDAARDDASDASSDHDDSDLPSEASWDSGLGAELAPDERPGPVGPGCPPGTCRPPAPFPHRRAPSPPPREDADAGTAAGTTAGGATRGAEARRAALAALKPPLVLDPQLEYGAGSRRGGGRGRAGPTPRRQHVAALVAALHRCVLAHDWARAARAFGLLLRTELGGRGPDVRRHGLWKIGAEILLRQAGQRGPPARGDAGRVGRRRSGSGARDEKVDDGDDGATNAEEDDPEPDSDPDLEPDPLTPEGFASAWRWYERLAVQYPETRWETPGVPTARHFHRAQFALWIEGVQAQQRRLEERAETGSDPPDAEDESMSEMAADAEGDVERGRETRPGFADVRRQALEIQTALRGLNYPHKEDEVLKRLAEDVDTWVADLKAGAPPPTESSPLRDDEMDVSDTSDGPSRPERAKEYASPPDM